MNDYREEIARLRAERNEIKYREISEDILHHDRQRLEAEQAAQEAIARGDSDSARWAIENAEQAEQSIANLSAELDQLDADAGAQAGQLTEAKRAWIERRQDLAADPRVVQVAGAAHNYLTQLMGIPDDSREYFELMSHALEPAGYEPMPTPDDIAEACGLTPDEYNKGVEKLWKAKANGQYKDKE